MTLAERIRTARRARQMSQETLAQRAGMSLRAFRSLERGEALDPHVSTVRKLSEALEVSPYALLGEEQQEVPLAEASPKEERRAYPYPWMLDDLARTIEYWQTEVRDRQDPRECYVIANACLHYVRSVLRYDAPGKTLSDRVPESEVAERIRVVDWLMKLASSASEVYAESPDAVVTDVEKLDKEIEQDKRHLRVLEGGAA